MFVEASAVETAHPDRETRLLSYMKLLDMPPGLAITFHALKLAKGVSGLILPGANLQRVRTEDRGNKNLPLC